MSPKASLGRIDPLVRLLLVAIALASLLPVPGEWRGVAQAVSNGAVFLLFLLNGLRLPRAEIIRGIGNGRFLLPLVAWCFGAMALAGWGLSLIVAPWLPPLVALGFLYLGTLPSTVQSATAYCSLAGGNVAHSVVAAALLNILGVVVTAPLFSLMAGSHAAALDLGGLEKVALILLLPFLIGQAAQNRFGHLVREHRDLAVWMDRVSIAIPVYVAFSGAVREGLWSLIGPWDWAVLFAAIVALLTFAFGGAWLVGGLARLERGDRIALLYSGAQKSIAMGAPLASVLFGPAAAGLVLLPVLVYHLLQLVLSAPLATRLNRN
jgi:sodium/bile acid cotransporter 7